MGRGSSRDPPLGHSALYLTDPAKLGEKVEGERLMKLKVWCGHCGVVGAVVLVGALAFAPTPVWAQVRQKNVHHKFIKSLVELANDPNGLAIDPGEGGGTGHLWVAVNNVGVLEFNASTGAEEGQVKQPSPPLQGSPESVAVGHGTGEAQVYVTYKDEVGVFGGSGAFVGRWTGPGSETFGELGGVAVDDSGELSDPGAGRVYVYDKAKGVVDVFKPKAGGGEEALEPITGPSGSEHFRLSDHLAVDQANGDVLVEDEPVGGKKRVIDVFKPKTMEGYELLRVITEPLGGNWEPGSPIPLAVDPGEGISFEEGDGYIVEEHARVIDECAVGSGLLVGRITGSETEGGTFGEVPGSIEPTILTSVAVDPVTHLVYVGVKNNAAGARPSVVVFGKGVVLPNVSYKEPASPVGVSNGSIEEKLVGKVDPLEKTTKEGATCQFVWSPSKGALSNLAKCQPEVVSGEEPKSVSAQVDGLQPDTTYFYRLQASNKSGTNPGEEEEDGEFTPPHVFTTPGPGLHGESVSSVASNSATLEATINPHEAATSYYFEYGRESCAASPSSCTVSSSAPEGAGSGEGDVEVAKHVQDLEPDTIYHYRAVVVSDLKFSPTESPHEYSFDEPEGTFRTRDVGGAPGLPDGRAWELVSPARKNGALILALNGEEADVQAAADGSAITYVTHSPTEVEGSRGYSEIGQVLSARNGSGGGWSSCELDTPRAAPEGTGHNFPEYPLFSTDLSSAMVEQEGFGSVLLSEEASERTPYLERLSECGSGSSFEPLVTGKEPFTDVPEGTRFGGSGLELAVRFIAASPDLRHVILASTVGLIKGAGPGVYEWSAEAPPAERLQLVSSGIQMVGSDHIGFPNANGRNIVSEDGTRVFWVDNAGFSFMHDSLTNETISTGRGVFQFATGAITGAPRRSIALFAEEGGALYQCEIVEEVGKVKCKLTTIAPSTAVVQRDILGASEDGSYVYFVANGVLGNGAERGATRGECKPEAFHHGEDVTCNLYVYHDGETRFIAKLSGEDEMDWGNKDGGFGHELEPLWTSVSPSGRYVAFMSSRSLTGYDNRDIKSGKPDEEIYLYDATTEHLVCASCDPTGARPTGVEENQSGAQLVFPRGGLPGYAGTSFAANLPGYTDVGAFGTALRQPRYLSNSGRLFFNADSALVPQDTNETEDVYEYEPQGVGSCVGPGVDGAKVVFRPAHPFEAEGRDGEESAGCVGLISSGVSAQESAFMDASENGGDVFFLTGEPLTSQDKDSAFDIYDAHECTGTSPCPPPEPTQAPECETTDSCRAAPTSQPEVFGVPSSATFNGPGNATTTTSPKTTPGPPPPPTLKQKLERALRMCHKDRSKKKRKQCERQARRRFGQTRAVGSHVARHGRGR